MQWLTVNPEFQRSSFVALWCVFLLGSDFLMFSRRPLCLGFPRVGVQTFGETIWVDYNTVLNNIFITNVAFAFSKANVFFFHYCFSFISELLK